MAEAKAEGRPRSNGQFTVVDAGSNADVASSADAPLVVTADARSGESEVALCLSHSVAPDEAAAV